nr:HD domain-containing phosphohydrolase [Clostridium paraputrificum]
MRLVPIESVRTGSYLGKTIYDNSGRILLKSGVLLTEGLIKKIKQLNIFSIYIEDNYSQSEIEDIIKPELRNKATSIIKDTFNNVEKLSNLKTLNSREKNKIIKEQEDYFNSINDIAEELLNNILDNKNLLVSLVDIKSMDMYTYQHCVNVAVISLVLGIGLQLPKSELIDLCTGALLHDIGKVFIPKDLITKEGPLTYEEFLKIKEHPRLGYPNALKGDAINKLAKIVSIADVYDALTSDRCYRRALCASDALEYIMANVNKLFDFNIVQVFSKIIVPFPFGTIVKLSTGDIAVVQETQLNYPLRPVVKIVKSSDSKNEGKLLNLINELSVVINNVEYNI